MDGVRAMAAHIGLYAKALAKWLILAVFVGAVCGGVGLPSISAFMRPRPCGDDSHGFCGACRWRGLGL